jgi:hypothetical protein
LDHVKDREILGPVEKFTDSLMFRSLAPALVSRIEAHKAAHNFAAPIASAYRLSPETTTISDRNRGPSGLDQLLKHKQRLRKLWQETRDLACKTEATGSLKL